MTLSYKCSLIVDFMVDNKYLHWQAPFRSVTERMYVGPRHPLNGHEEEIKM